MAEQRDELFKDYVFVPLEGCKRVYTFGIAQRNN
jgi:hypothetical protein